MPRTDLEQLVVSLEARITQFEKNFQKANRTANRNFRQIEDRADTAANRLEKRLAGAANRVSGSMNGIGKSIIAGFAGGLAVGGIDQLIGKLGNVVSSVAEVGREARRAGVSVKTFQEFKAVAQQTKIPVDALVDGLKEMSLRADEFVSTAGKGSAGEAFQRLGYTVDEVAAKLENPNDLLLEIFERTQALGKAAQIRIFDELFGGSGGERMVELLGRGADGIRTIISEAHAAGAVLDDEMIAKAEKLDEAFAKAGRSVEIYLKRGVLNVIADVQALDDAIDKLGAKSGLREMLGITDDFVKDAEKATAKLDKLREQRDALLAVKAKTGGMLPPGYERELDDLGDMIEVAATRVETLNRTLYGEGQEGAKAAQAALAATANAAADTGDAASQTKQETDRLSESLRLSGTSGADATKGIATFADGLRALKSEIPGLAAELRGLDSAMKIEEAYLATVNKAQTMGQVQQAGQYRDQALAASRATAAGSDSANYLAGRLAPGKSASVVEGLRGDFADALARMIASAPDDVRGQIGIQSAYRSPEHQARLFEAAVKKYGSVSAARRWVAPPGKSQHGDGEAVDLSYGSEKARQWMHQNAARFGMRFPMQHEPWHIEPADARKAVAPKPARLRRIDEGIATPRVPTARPETEAEKAAAKAVADHNRELERKRDAYASITTGAGERLSTSEMERQSIGMTTVNAAALRHEHEMLAQAQRAGIELTARQRAEISALARGMAEAETSLQSMAETQAQSAEIGQFFGQGITDALTGIITGSMTAEQALKQLLSQLVQVGLQGALMGTGPLASLFSGGGKGGAAKGGSGLLGGILGFASGGPVRGPGTGTSDSIPARLSDGEFVVNARATRQHRAVLEAINSGRVPAFAAGGAVGTAPRFSVPRMAGGGAGQQVVNISNVVKVEGSGGTPEQNDDLTKKMSKALDAQMRGVVTDELRKQGRAGGSLRR